MFTVQPCAFVNSSVNSSIIIFHFSLSMRHAIFKVSFICYCSFNISIIILHYSLSMRHAIFKVSFICSAFVCCSADSGFIIVCANR